MPSGFNCIAVSLSTVKLQGRMLLMSCRMQSTCKSTIWHETICMTSWASSQSLSQMSSGPGSLTTWLSREQLRLGTLLHHTHAHACCAMCLQAWLATCCISSALLAVPEHLDRMRQLRLHSNLTCCEDDKMCPMGLC